MVDSEYENASEKKIDFCIVRNIYIYIYLVDRRPTYFIIIYN